MDMILIAVHYKDLSFKEIVGFRIFQNDKYLDVPYNKVYQVIKSGKVTISGLDIENGKLHGSNGALDRYAKIVNNKLIGTSPMVVTKQIGGLGYEVVVYDGQKKKLETANIVKLASRIGIANAKVVGGERISSIRGTFDIVDTKPVAKKETQTIIKKAQENKDDIVIQGNYLNETDKFGKVKKVFIQSSYDSIYRPRLLNKIYNEDTEEFGKMYDEIDKITVDEKMAQCLVRIQQIRGFYSSALRTIDKRLALDCETMGVTNSMLVYNPYFVLNMSVPNLIFILMHETMHLIMKHPIRKENRNHLIFNMACDYYINKFLVDELDMKKGSIDVTREVNNLIKNTGATLADIIQDLNERGFKARVHKDNKIYAETYFGVFSDGIEVTLPISVLWDDTVDIATDTPETIYKRIYNEFTFKKERVEGNGSGNTLQQGGNGSNSGDGNGDGNQSGENSNSEKSNTGDKSNNSEKESNENSGQDNGNNGIGIEVTKVYRDGKLVDQAINDIYTTNDDINKSETQLENEARAIGERASVLYKKLKSSGYGDNPSNLEREYIKMTAPKLNWKALLRTKFNKLRQKVMTYAAPDRRFLSRNMILPGPKALESDGLQNIRFCVDTSGSMDITDLSEAYAYIKYLVKKYNADGQIWSWDAEVDGKMDIKTTADLLTIRFTGGGGTDVKSVFKELDKEYKIKKVLPAVVIIYTDGYFSYKGLEEFKKRYHNKVIWLLTTEQAFKDFEVDWGIKAPVKYER